jgi:hypothetical protein
MATAAPGVFAAYMTRHIPSPEASGEVPDNHRKNCAHRSIADWLNAPKRPQRAARAAFARVGPGCAVSLLWLRNLEITADLSGQKVIDLPMARNC